MKPNVVAPIANAQTTGTGSGTFEATSDLKATYLVSPNELGVIHHVRETFTSDCTFSGSLKYFDLLGSRSAGYYPAPYGAQWATCQISSEAVEDFTSGTTSSIGVPTFYTFYALEDQPDFQPYATDRNWVGGGILLSNDHTAGVGITLYVHPARTDIFPSAIFNLPGRMNWTQGSNGVTIGAGSFSHTEFDSHVCGPCDPGSTFVIKSSASFQVTSPSNQPPANHPPKENA